MRTQSVQLYMSFDYKIKVNEREKNCQNPQREKKIAKTTLFFIPTVSCYVCLLPKTLESCGICEILVD